MIKRVCDYLIQMLNSCREFGFLITYKLYVKDRLQGKTPNERDLLISEDVSAYFWKHYSFVMEERIPNDDKKSSFNAVPNSPIWLFWWQGIDSMPDIVKTCYRSICNHIPSNYDVVLLTKDNYGDYSDLPQFIINRMEDGLISLAHFSDVLRANLILHHGGIWLDATVYVSKPINPSWFDMQFFSLIPYFRGEKYKGYSWSCFAWGGKKGCPVFYYLYSFYLHYLQEHTAFITYLWQDDFVKMMYNHYPEVKSIIDKGSIEVHNLFEMQQILGDRFDSESYKRLCEEDVFHKLTYKRGNVKGEGYMTLYEYLIKDNSNHES